MNQLTYKSNPAFLHHQNEPNISIEENAHISVGYTYFISFLSVGIGLLHAYTSICRTTTSGNRDVSRHGEDVSPGLIPVCPVCN
jgi:hypothetical protein